MLAVHIPGSDVLETIEWTTIMQLSPQRRKEDAFLDPVMHPEQRCCGCTRRRRSNCGPTTPRSRDLKSIPEEVRTFSAFPKPAKLRAYRVVIPTCSSAGFLQVLKIRPGHFNHIVQDEAAHVEDELLASIPIVAVSNGDTDVILEGLMLFSKIYGPCTEAGKT